MGTSWGKREALHFGLVPSVDRPKFANIAVCKPANFYTWKKMKMLLEAKLSLLLLAKRIVCTW